MSPTTPFSNLVAFARDFGFWYRTSWSMALAALVAVGARSLRAEPRAESKTFRGPDAALEMHAEYAAGKSGALEPLRFALSGLPPEKPLLVFVHSGDVRGSLAEQLVLYLTWPRKVFLSEAPPGAAGETIAQLREKYGGLVLCGWHAPEGVPGVARVGPGVEVAGLAVAQP